ncbi:MAG: hypothetical protein ACRD2O_05430 [Terriglobia bacterium]
MRIQLDFDEDGVNLINEIKESTGLSTYKDVFNNALTLFEWAIRQGQKGRVVGSLDEENENYSELQMPALQRASRRAAKAQSAMSGK